MTEAEAKPRILETAEEVAPPAASSPSPARKTKKRRPLRWSNFSYTTRVTLAFALIAAMTALVAIGVVSFVWEQHFRTYTADNMQTLCETTANRIAALYKQEADRAAEAGVEGTDPLWDPEVTKPAAQATELTSGVGVKVVDIKGGTPFDSSWVVDENHDGHEMSLEPPDRTQVASEDIMVDGRRVGEVRLWVYGSEALMRQPDQEFLPGHVHCGRGGHRACLMHRLFVRAQLGGSHQPHHEDGPGHRQGRPVGPHRAARRGRDRAPGRDVRRDGRLHRARPRAGAPSDHRRGA